ncbi:MAG: hypothetical protein IKX53_08395 [Bacteroidales bacterium]|nr:hypothetical protein [Bacteroidales bacterium]
MKKSKPTKSKKTWKGKKTQIKRSPARQRRLEFLRTLLATSDVTFNDLARHFNVSRVTVGNWFFRDDIHLSTLDQICTYCGYEFQLSLCRSAYEPDEPVPQLGRRALQYQRGNLQFLCVAMARRGITAKEISEKMERNISTVQYWFNTNDMNLSRVEAIAAAFDMSVRIDIFPRDSAAFNPRSSRVEFRPLVFDRELM